MFCSCLDVNVSIQVPVNPANEDTPLITAESFVAALPATFSVLAVAEGVQVTTQLSVCPAGYYCVTRDAVPVPCPLGTYYPLPGAQNESQCESCPSGRVCGLGTAIPLNCSAGTFRNATGGESLETDCEECYVGSYCVSGSERPVACVPGTVRATPGGTGPESCSPCPTGSWCGENTSVPTLCAAGTFRNDTGGATADSCSTCIAGSFCVEGASVPTHCPGGTYSPSTGASGCIPCPEGSVCDVGTITPVPCDAGTFRNITSGESQGDCTPCIIGHYCQSGSVYPSACSTGTYQMSAGMSVCDLCSSGEYQSETGLNFCNTCGAGTYLTGSGMTASSDCVSCHAGSYQTGHGMTSFSDCTPCASNHYCPTPTSVFDCPEFSHSPNGTAMITSCVCDLGYEGPNGGPCTICNTSVWCRSGTANNCPENSLVNFPGGGALSDCMCVGGFFGYAMNTIGVPCAVCQANSYCEGGAANLTVDCPYGEYSPPGTETVSACYCPANASSGPGATNFNMCTCNPRFKRVNNETFFPTGWECVPCGANEVCFNDTSIICPPNSYSAVSVPSYNQCVCNPGYYHGNTSDYDHLCTQCDADYYCTGDSTRRQCNPLMVAPPQSVNVSACYCIDGYVGKGNDTCSPCPAGYYCTLGNAFQCPFFSTSPVQSSTLSQCQCLSGYWGPNGGSCRACLPGTSKTFTGCVNCSNQVATDCATCPLGSYANITANGAPCSLCPAGTYLDSTGNLALSACKSCAKGTYQTGQGLTAQSDCQYCGVGTYGTGTAMIAASNCSLCQAGTYQSGVGMQNCILCSPGSYGTSIALSVCALCSPGTYSSVPGAITNSVCQNCSYGSYASSSGASRCTLCFPHSNTTIDAATSSSQCFCSPGYQGNCTSLVGYTPSNLMQYFKFGNNSTLSDSSGNGKSLTVLASGAEQTTETPLLSHSSIGSVQFNNGAMLWGPSFTLDSTPHISFCFWIKPMGGMNGETPFVVLKNNIMFFAWAMYRYSGTTWISQMMAGNVNGYWMTLPEYTWTHVCQVHNNPERSVATYLNSVLKDVGANRKNTIYGTQWIFPGETFRVLLGATNEQVTYYNNLLSVPIFNGKITEVMVIGQLLTATQIENIYYGSINCPLCTANYYCAGGLAQAPCPNNTYSWPGSSSVSQCVCPDNAQWILGLNCTCNPGFYKVTNDNALGGWQCNTCPVAYYCYNGIATACPLSSSSLTSSYVVGNCTGCLPGFMKISDGNCTACRLGYYCPNMITEIICPAGRYCPFLATAPIQCAANYYSLAGATSCTICPTNQQSTAGSAGCVCNPGYYGPAYRSAIMRTGGFAVSQYTLENVSYSVTSFLSSGTITFYAPTLVDVLIVGGGGGGGWNAGGGGGGGGVIYQASVMVPAGTYQVTVGKGGVGSNYSIYSSNQGNLTNGGLSSIFGGTAYGGGGGACFINRNLQGNSGGSGGGGAPLAGLGGSALPAIVTGTILTAPLIAGFAGAAAGTTVGGGGGGAYSLGGYTGQTSDGGIGFNITIYNGTEMYFAGGGGGGTTSTGTRAGVAGAGGAGGGGGYSTIPGGLGGLYGINLGNSGTAGYGGSAGPNTGGGGGGTCQDLAVSP